MGEVGLGSASGVLTAMRPLVNPPAFHTNIKSFYKELESKFSSRKGILNRNVSVLAAANNIARQKGAAIQSLIDFTA